MCCMIVYYVHLQFIVIRNSLTTTIIYLCLLQMLRGADCQPTAPVPLVSLVQSAGTLHLTI